MTSEVFKPGQVLKCVLTNAVEIFGKFEGFDEGYLIIRNPISKSYVAISNNVIAVCSPISMAEANEHIKRAGRQRKNVSTKKS